MITTEFPIDLDNNQEGLGELFITDATLLVQPRKVPGQYPASVPHDTVHSYDILRLGNDMGEYTTHIVSQVGPKETHKLLDRVFYAFVDACCLQLWCDARVCYIVDGKTLHVEEYGFEDGQYTMIFNVYCGIAEDQTEEFLATLTADETGRFIVVRPNLSQPGYSLHGFTVEQSGEDEGGHGMTEAEENDLRIQDCCGRPYYDCTCAEEASFRAFHADPATAGSWWTP